MSSPKVLGNLAAFLAASLFGVTVVVTRVVIQEVPPLSLAVFRFGQGGFVLFLCLFIGARDLLKVKSNDLPFLILLGGIFFALFPMTFHLGISRTEASRGALMIATMPIWSACLARLAGKEKLIPRQAMGVLVTFVGVGVVLAERGLSWQSTASTLAGDGLMLLTAFFGAAYGVLAKRLLERYPALTVTTYAMIFGTLLLFPAALVEGLPHSLTRIEGNLGLMILFLGIIGGALGFLLWTFALTNLSPTQVAVYGNLNPMVATILGVALLAEKLTWTFAVGFVAIVAGVLVVNWPSRDLS